ELKRLGAGEPAVARGCSPDSMGVKPLGQARAVSAGPDADPATAGHRDPRAAGDDESQSRRDDVGCLESGPRQIPAVLRAVRVGTARLGAGAVRTCAVRRTVVRRTTAGIGRTVRAIGGAV